ncbi:MAG TPA: hypothetical protein O0Y16_05190, partial [Methanocorpusculum sp.]|nr:hypothetical protein [Methanocorpusculum sp.]
MVTRPDDLFPIEERLTLREKAEIYHQTVTLPLKTRLEEVLADFFIEEDGEIERGRKVMEFVIHWTIIIGMFYGEIREWKKLLRENRMRKEERKGERKKDRKRLRG